MKFPFTTEQFLNVFKLYNETVFPLQLVFYLAALYCLFVIFTQTKKVNLIVACVLSFFWFWIGIVYHILFFSEINKAAYIFGIFYIVQGILFVYHGVYKSRLSFSYEKNYFNITGLIFILYALIIYPLLGFLFGHRYPSSPTFGLPCPTTIFTFGILLLANRKISIGLIIIPALWAIIGFSAALNLSIYEDIGLLVSGVIGFVLILIANKNYARQKVTSI